MNSENGNSIKTPRMGSGVSITEGVTGLATVALAIIGLADIFPWLLGAIATIALGAALVFEAGAITARFAALEPEGQGSLSLLTWGRWGTMSAGFLAGCAGIALGILAILHVDPEVLIPIAVIVYGAALIMDSGVRVRLSTLESEHAGLHGMSKQVAREAAAASSGIQVLVGLGGITLGILATIGISSQTLCLVALLSIGSAILVVGSFVGGRVIGMYRG